MKQQFLLAIGGTIRLTAYANNRPLIPADSVTITLYKPTGAVLQAEASATRDATTGEMTYTISTTHAATADLNYKAVWKYTVSGTTEYQTQLFDVVKSMLAIPIVDEDLFNELSSLRQTAKQVQGTATAGAAGSLTDTGQKDYTDDFWTGGVIEIIAGTGEGQQRDITDYVQSTGVFSVSPNWATNPSTDSIYRAVSSYTKKIAQSFDKIETMLYNKGKRHSLILESSQIKFPLIYLTIHFICLDNTVTPDDRWSLLATKYWELFNNEFNNMRLEYDEDESGFIDEQERMKNLTEIRVDRS